MNKKHVERRCMQRLHVCAFNLTSCTILNKWKNLTPQLLTKAPASLEGKGEPEILLPSPFRGGVGGGVSPDYCDWCKISVQTDLISHSDRVKSKI
jgi:hypothetical protein